MNLTIYYFSVLKCLLNIFAGDEAMQNAKILIKTDKPFNSPNAARELKFHFTTVPRWNKKVKIFSSPIHGVDYLHINGVQTL